MEKKYQVFVSSTQSDLNDERDAAMRAILEIGHIPVGMEMFSAADDDSWTLIKRQIDASDYYIVIIAHRYGSTDPKGLSYTEKEYDYAVECGIPVLGFVIEENAAWPNDRRDDQIQKQEALKAFKMKVKARQVAFWKDAGSLQARVLASLPKQMNLIPRPGWIRGSAAAGPEVLAELSRLSSENAELRSKVASPTVPELAFHISDVRFVEDDESAIAYSDFAIQPLNSQDCSIPLKFIRTVVRLDQNELELDTQSCEGLPEDGKNGNDTHLAVTGPRAASLTAWAESQRWLRTSLKLSIYYEFKPLGYDAVYRVDAELARDTQDDDVPFLLVRSRP